MYLAIITLPLLGSIVSGFFGRKVGVSGAQIITCTSVIVTTLLAIVAFFEVGLNNIPVSINLFRWIDSESLNVLWGFHFDSLTVSMLIPVLIVSSLVHIYSIGYMSHDPHNQRFFSYLSLFTFMMIILVTANNFLLMFVGWEGVGICSYLLVSFWFTRIAANQSSMSAFLTNRVGDCFLTIGMFAILWSFGNIDYSTVFSLAPFVNENIVTIIGICLLIGAMAKSSQVGLHVWLPMAMEGWFYRALLKLHYMRKYPALILGPLKRYFLLGKIQEEGQSAGNSIRCQFTLGKDRGSSETRREEFILKDNVFKFWFIGFTEGDGSFIINKNGYLEFKITQSSLDAQVLFFIKRNLGFGVVRLQDKNNKTHCFRVRDKQGLLKIISVFNGNIFMETRKAQFKLFIYAYNKIYKTNIVHLENNSKPDLSTSWLCGFTDAEGSFTCSIIDRSKEGGLVILRYILSQKGNFEQMEYLGDLLNGKTHYLKSYGGYNMTVNTTKLSLIIKYFDSHPLKTKKSIVYFNWNKMFKLVLAKKHLTDAGLITIKKYNKNLNRLDKII
jgi:Proton-conducting membrane transporter/NADH-Ubiquinone oxidoreductase (complex I), chain 5 N-terminus/LAGLIDADG endonuclease